MTLRFTPRALAEAKRVQAWWRRSRPAAATLFSRELMDALERIEQMPHLGRLYEEAELGAPVRRVLLPRTLNHVYYLMDDTGIVVLSVWSAVDGRGPTL